MVGKTTAARWTTATAAACGMGAMVLMLLTGAQPAAAADGKTAPAKPKVAAKTSAPAKATASATLTGCLHADGAKYVLTDLTDKQAPKGRSWKTAFMTKHSKDVEIVGASASVKLKDQVGHKVAIVGTRDGETHMKAQSVKQVARSCS